MWTQTKTGYYTNGADVLEVISLGSNDFSMKKNGEFQDYIGSLEELTNCLEKLQLEPLALPKMEVECNKWITFEGSDDVYEKAFTRKLENEMIQTVIFVRFSDSYSVMLRETFYEDGPYFTMLVLEFVEEKGRSAKDILELDAYEAMTHGASGMSKCHHDLQTMDEVKHILKNTYGIVYED